MKCGEQITKSDNESEGKGIEQIEFVTLFYKYIDVA